MVRTFGLTHLALAVEDPERAFRFYQRVLGMIAVYRHENFIQAQTPGAQDAIVFEKKPGRHAGTGGIAHFGFRLQDPSEIEAAVGAVREAGGAVESQGEFCPGEPYVFFRDPDGYEVEIWYEPPAALNSANDPAL